MGLPGEGVGNAVFEYMTLCFELTDLRGWGENGSILVSSQYPAIVQMNEALAPCAFAESSWPFCGQANLCCRWSDGIMTFRFCCLCQVQQFRWSQQ